MTKITAELTAGTQVTVSNGRHTWRGDEPPEAKGTDLAPSPYEQLLGALAACTCITISLYSQHKGIALKSVAASYEFRRIQPDKRDGDNSTRGSNPKESSHARARRGIDMQVHSVTGYPNAAPSGLIILIDVGLRRRPHPHVQRQGV